MYICLYICIYVYDTYKHTYIHIYAYIHTQKDRPMGSTHPNSTLNPTRQIQKGNSSHPLLPPNPNLVPFHASAFAPFAEARSAPRLAHVPM